MTHGPGQAEWTVPIEEEGERLDRFLAARVKDWSRSKLQAFIKQGLVDVDGAPQLKSGAPLAPGDRVRARLPASRPSAAAVRERRLSLLFEDDDLLVVDKPAGLLTHRREGSGEVTLAELAVAHCGPLPSPQGVDRPGIVHRLDRETSGVVVVGKNEASLQSLMAQFKAREVEKTYALIVTGEPRFASDWIDEPIGRDPRRPERVGALALEQGGRAASTYYEVVERFEGFAHLIARPKTGRTHQIRVHMTLAGMEVVGDKVYRLRNSRRRDLPEGTPPPRRQMLHAARLEFTHPSGGQRVSFESPPPADFATLLEHLRG